MGPPTNRRRARNAAALVTLGSRPAPSLGYRPSDSSIFSGSTHSSHSCSVIAVLHATSLLPDAITLPLARLSVHDVVGEDHGAAPARSYNSRDGPPSRERLMTRPKRFRHAERR